MSTLKIPTKEILKKYLSTDLFGILVQSGFDLDSTILQLNTESIKSIEIHVNENKNIILKHIQKLY